MKERLLPTKREALVFDLSKHHEIFQSQVAIARRGSAPVFHQQWARYGHAPQAETANISRCREDSAQRRGVGWNELGDGFAWPPVQGALSHCTPPPVLVIADAEGNLYHRRLSKSLVPFPWRCVPHTHTLHEQSERASSYCSTQAWPRLGHGYQEEEGRIWCGTKTFLPYKYPVPAPCSSCRHKTKTQQCSSSASNNWHATVLFTVSRRTNAEGSLEVYHRTNHPDTTSKELPWLLPQTSRLCATSNKVTHRRQFPLPSKIIRWTSHAETPSTQQ